MISDDIFTALSTIGGVAGLFDSKLPDGYVLAAPVIVFSSVSDTPEDVAIDGEIMREAERWQVSIRVPVSYKDTGGRAPVVVARALKAAVIAALHGYIGGDIVRADYESCPGQVFEAEIAPFQYHLPIDFMIQH